MSVAICIRLVEKHQQARGEARDGAGFGTVELLTASPLAQFSINASSMAKVPISAMGTTMVGMMV